jgi:hypothetical protein
MPQGTGTYGSQKGRPAKKDKKRFPHSMGKPAGMSELEYGKTLSKREQKLRYGPAVGRPDKEQKKKLMNLAKDQAKAGDPFFKTREKVKKKAKKVIKNIGKAIMQGPNEKMSRAKRMAEKLKKKKQS